MPKKASARKSKTRKKPQIDEKGLPGRWEIAAMLCKPFLGHSEFIEALEKSKLVEHATEAYKTRQLSQCRFLLHMGMDKQEWGTAIDEAVKQYKDTLPRALYAAALITASQTSPFISRHFMEKSFIRGLANWLFVESREQEALLIDGRGRKSKIETYKVYEAIFNRGADASRKSVAFDLRVSEKTLDNWRKAQRFPTWKAAVKYAFVFKKKLSD